MGVQLIGVFRNRDTIMKLAACMVLAVAEAKLKIKNLDIPDASFFTFAHSDEKHMGLPVNKKRKNANSPRDFVCFPQCADWTKKKQNSNPNSFTGCRLHAPITNPINGWATCQKGKWVVEKPLKKCFCDLCDPRDAQ